MDSFPESKFTIDEMPECLRWLRKMRKLTLKQTAEKTGLSVSFLSDIERGRTRPSIETLSKLATAYAAPFSLQVYPTQ